MSRAFIRGCDKKSPCETQGPLFLSNLWRILSTYDSSWEISPAWQIIRIFVSKTGRCPLLWYQMLWDWCIIFPFFTLASRKLRANPMVNDHDSIKPDGLNFRNSLDTPQLCFPQILWKRKRQREEKEAGILWKEWLACHLLYQLEHRFGFPRRHPK